MRSQRLRTFGLSTTLMAIALCVGSVFPQSADPSFPTPLTTNLVSATIKARDIGDSRLTTQYYAFGGDQGDIFINVVTKNFDGDIDVFTADGMRPLTKMVIYSDSGVNETGRLIYLRKSEKLLLRIEGRPPDDSAATVQVKFGGSFVAMLGRPGTVTEAPTVATGELGNVRVNSVGTIIEVPEVKKSEIKMAPAETVAVTPKKEINKPAETKRETIGKAEKSDAPTGKSKPEKVNETAKKPAKRDEPASKAENEPKKPVDKKPEPKNTTKAERKAMEAETERADPLANIRLVVAFKNGDKLERPLSEVLKFSVDKGTLTVIAKDGSIRRYSMLDVAEVTIK